MSYQVRTREDGQFEVVELVPLLVGTFPEREYAERFLEFLRDTKVYAGHGLAQPGSTWLAPYEPPPGRSPTGILADARPDPAPSDKSADESRPAANLVAARRSALLTPAPAAAVNLPAVIAAPKPPAVIKVVTPADLTEEQVNAAFFRIANGEKIATVAPDFGLTMFVLRGMWANHKRQMQKHLADGGQTACATCQRAFTPSISHPEKCARCSHE